MAALASAAYTSAEFWHAKVKFLPSLGLFNNNAHLHGATLMKLIYDSTTLERSGGLSEAGGEGGGGGGGGSAAPTPSNSGGKTVTKQVSELLQLHYQMSANLLMHLKARQEGKVEGKMPLQLMIFALQMSTMSTEKLVRLCERESEMCECCRCRRRRRRSLSNGWSLRLL